MIGVQLSLRRLSGLAVGALLGLTTALVVASPASAHDAKVSGEAVCDTDNGQWVITWTVRNDQQNKDATVVSVTTSPDTPVEGIEAGSVVPRDRPAHNNGRLSGTQRVPGTTTEANLAVGLNWPRFEEHGRTHNGSVTLQGTCQPTPKCIPVADAKFKHTFDGANGTGTVALKGELPLCDGQKQDFTLVSYFMPKPTFSLPQYLHDSDTGTITDKVREIELNVELPNCFTQVDMFFGGEDEIIDPLVEDGPRYGNKILGSNGPPGNRSYGPRAAWHGGDKSCTEPKASFVSDCDGSVTVNLSNTGKYATTFEVVGENGFSESVPVRPGEVGVVRVPAEAAGNIKVTSEGRDVATGSWERPKNCAPPTVVAKADCDNLTVTVKNPTGNVPAKATVKYGTQTKEITVAAGVSEKVTFPRSTAETATVTFPDLDLELEATVPAKPANCGGGGGGLPVTGAAVGGWVAAAGLLLSAGAGLFLVARRRRIRFTA